MSDETSLLLNISDMIDLAIGTPEVGVVDFGMLHTVLHCLAQQLRVLGKNVELRGSVAMLPSGKDHVQSISVSEYLVDTDDQGPTPKIIKKAEPTPPLGAPVDETILVVERIQKKRKDLSPIRARSPPPAPRETQPSKEVMSPERLSLVTISKFNVLESAVEDLKNRVYGSIPTNEDILEDVRSQTNLKAITDMWTSLNVSSRLEAAEAGIAKLSSLVQDAIAEGMQRAQSAPPPSIPPPAPPSPPKPPPTPAPIPPKSEPSQIAQPEQLVPPSSTVEPASREELINIQQYLERLRGDLDNLANTFYSTIGELQSIQETISAIPQPPLISTAEMISPRPPSATDTQLPPISAVEVISPRLPTTTESTTASKPPPPTSTAKIISAPSTMERRQSEYPRRFSAMTAGLMDRINELEKRLNKCCDSIGKNDGVIQDQINSFQDQLEYLMKQVAKLTDELASGKLSPDLIKDLQGLMRLFQTVQEMQEQLKQVHETALQLAGEKEDRQYHMDALLEQIELLKTIKLDREDMIEAMADKADLRMLARKVSHDQFELACDDLSRGLDHAIGKLNTQESLWQQALDDIQREIEMKLDKMELSPVKDFFNTKLRQLQDNLKQMAALRKEVEAAGTKRKLLRDVQCLSCDANAVMQTEAPSSLPISRPMPANMSMKPYLSYELDTIRKAQATNVPQRNLHDWENIDKQMNQQKQQQRPRSETGKHICNRYCGGSHTVTTAAQRVARLGHFVKQWGPDVIPLSSGMAAGDDGRLYKVSPAIADNVAPGGPTDSTCTPKKVELPKAPQKPMLAGIQECRCLDGDQPSKK